MKVFEDEYWKKVSEENEVLPNFHPIDEETFVVLGKIHMMKCQEKSHVLGLCGFKCKEDYKEENQEKALLLFRLIDTVEEQQDDEVKKKLIDLKPSLFGIVWSNKTKKDFIKKI